MGRKADPAAPKQPEINNEAIKKDLAKADERTKQLAVIDEKFGGVEPYQRDRVLAEAAFFKRQAGQSCFELGKRLILLKEHEGHGKFLPALEALKISARAAQRCMVTAAKFGKYDTLTHLNQSKLLEMSMLDDADLEQLDKGGTVAGLTFDKIDEMTVAELKTQLKKVEDENADLNTLIAKKDEKLNTLDRKLRKLPDVQPFADDTKELLKEILNYGVAMEDSIHVFEQHATELIERVNALQPTDAEQESIAFATWDAISRSAHAFQRLQMLVHGEFEAFITTRYQLVAAEGGAQ